MLRFLCTKLVNSKVSNFTHNGLSSSSFILKPISKMSNSTDPRSLTITFLKKSCGLSQESAISASKKICIETPEKADLFLKLMKNHGLTKTLLKKIIQLRPSLLLSDLDCRIRPNLELFESLGISGSVLGKSLCKQPYMLVSRAREFVDFFRGHGFSDKQITAIIVKRPPLFKSNPDRNFRPKIEFLKSIGLSDVEVAEVLSSQTILLERSLENRIIPFCQVLRQLFGADIFKAVKFWRFIGIPDSVETLEKNVCLLKKHGVPEPSISTLFKILPSVFVLKLDRLKEVLEEVEKLGFEPTSEDFSVAVRHLVFVGKASWERKFESFKRYGLSTDEIYAMYKSEPRVMRLSVEKLERLMDFYVERLKMKPTDIWTRPHLLRHSLVNNVIPRCSVLQVLMLRNALNRETSISTYLRMKEDKFAEKTVTKFRDVIPDVVKAHQGELVFQEFPNVLWLRK